MSREALEAFRRVVPGEPRLEEALREAGEPRAFAALLSRLARERGLFVAEADVLAALAERRREVLTRWP